MTTAAWVGLWMVSHWFNQGVAVRLDWPDGKPLTEQTAITVMMFALITEEVSKEMTD